MENTQICEQIIKDFNGKKIQGKFLTSESYKYVDL